MSGGRLFYWTVISHWNEAADPVRRRGDKTKKRVWERVLALAGLALARGRSGARFGVGRSDAAAVNQGKAQQIVRGR